MKSFYVGQQVEYITPNGKRGKILKLLGDDDEV